MKNMFVHIVAYGFCGIALTLMAEESSNRTRFNLENDIIVKPLSFRGDLSPANAAYTIDRSGVYKLTSAKSASGVPNISITANNVTLDLGGNLLSGGTNGIHIAGDNVTVKNGSISGMTQNGVLVQGAGCRIEGLDISQGTTGITLQNCTQCVVEKCSVRNITQAGISLQSTWTSSVSGCELSGVHGSATIQGIVAQSGGNNTITTCVVRDMQTNSAVASDKVVGIALSNETASALSANVIQTIDSLTTVSSYGLWIESGNHVAITNNSVSGVTTVNAQGQGLFVNQIDSYVAQNAVYECDSSFAGISPEYITSQADARGVYNIDASSTTPDKIEEIHTQQLPTIEGNVDALHDSVESTESFVDRALTGVAIPVREPGTLATAGSYCLEDTINGGLSITGNDITLCMNEHTLNGGQLLISGDYVTVSDGTVRNNLSSSGVVLTGNNCFLNNMRSINNRTGFELSSADKNTLTNCTALGCTREGFLLNTSERNYIADCSVQSLVGTGTIAGFKTSDGISNTFKNCSVNGIVATNGDAYGLWGNTEHKSLFLGNSINDVSTSAGNAKGFALEQDIWLNDTLNFSWKYYSPTYQLEYSPAWISVRPGLAYVAFIADSTGTPLLTIFRYDYRGFNLCYTLQLPGDGKAVRWLQANGTIYLAATWAATSAETQVYLFDVVSEELLALPNATYLYSSSGSYDPYNLAWLLLPDGRIFLGLVGYSATSGYYNIQIVSFDGDRLSLVSRQSLGSSTVGGIDWLNTGEKIFLAAVLENTANTLTVYEYDLEDNSLLLRQSYNSGNGNGTGASWLSYKNSFYIALTLAVSTGDEVRVLSFNSSTYALDLLDSVDIGDFHAAKNLDWLVTGTSVYLGFATFVNTAEVNVYRFDPNAEILTSYYVESVTDAYACYGVQWFTGEQGRALLAAGFACTIISPNLLAVKVLGFDLIGTTSSLVLDTTVSNIEGTGIEVNRLSDGILKSSVSHATLPYRVKPGQYDPSNITIVS